MRQLLVLASAVTFCLGGFAAAPQAPTPPQAPPPAPPAPKAVECGPEGCRVRATHGFTVVPTPRFAQLPEGYRWVPTAQGHGLADPYGEWNNVPSATNTERLNLGYYYTPLPGRDPSPRGWWVSPCIKDADCRVVDCLVPAIGQHGEPTAPNAVELATGKGNAYHPNDHVGGYQRVLKCVDGTCAAPPVAWVGAAPPKQAPACSYCSNCTCRPGVCPAQCPLSYADACAKVKAGERVYLSVGKRVESVKVCVGGTCRMLPVTAHTDTLKGFPEGVYECFLLNGSPVMAQVPR